MEFAEYDLATFHQHSKPIVDEFLSLTSPAIQSVKISSPYKISSGFGFEWHYTQSAHISLNSAAYGVANKLVIMASWRLQDDGFTPYAVLRLTRISVTPDIHSVSTEIDNIYPTQIPQLKTFINSLLVGDSCGFPLLIKHG